MIEPPKPVSEGWLIRLRCQNPGAPGRFRAEVVAAEGAPSSGRRAPWDLAWRAQAGKGPVELKTREGELLRLAILTSGPTSSFVLLGAAADGSELRQPAGATDEIVLTVRVYRADRTDTEKRVHLSSRRGDDGSIVPMVTFAP